MSCRVLSVVGNDRVVHQGQAKSLIQRERGNDATLEGSDARERVRGPRVVSLSVDRLPSNTLLLHEEGSV